MMLNYHQQQQQQIPNALVAANLNLSTSVPSGIIPSGRVNNNAAVTNNNNSSSNVALNNNNNSTYYSNNSSKPGAAKWPRLLFELNVDREFLEGKR